MDNIEKGYTAGLICGVVALVIGAISGYALLMILALFPIWINAILLQRYRSNN